MVCDTDFHHRRGRGRLDHSQDHIQRAALALRTGNAVPISVRNCRRYSLASRHSAKSLCQMVLATVAFLSFQGDVELKAQVLLASLL